MSRYRIVSLNYLAAGDRRVAVNLDTVVGYELSSVDHLLAQEPVLSSLLAVENGGNPSAILQAKLSCCSERLKNAVSSFNASRFRPNRSFIAEFSQKNEEQNRLGAFGYDRGGLYDMMDEALKTAEKKPQSTLPKIGETSDATDDEYIPDLTKDPLQFCQIGERSYFMTEPTCRSYRNLRIDIDPYAEVGHEFYTAALRTNDAKTYLYAPVSELSSESYGEYFRSDNQTISALQAKIDGFFAPYEELRGVEYNHLFGMLNGWRSRYESGNVYGDTYTMKNMYDATYSMDMRSPDELSRAREYDGMCANSGTLYLKYRDDISYRRSGSGWTKSVPGERTFQKMERFQPVKSQDLKNSRHKSNFFSVGIRNTGLDDAESAECAAVRQEIENAVRSIALALSPANTQLFEVRFEKEQ